MATFGSRNETIRAVRLTCGGVFVDFKESLGGLWALIETCGQIVK